MVSGDGVGWVLKLQQQTLDSEDAEVSPQGRLMKRRRRRRGCVAFWR